MRFVTGGSALADAQRLRFFELVGLAVERLQRRAGGRLGELTEANRRELSGSVQLRDLDAVDPHLRDDEITLLVDEGARKPEGLGSLTGLDVRLGDFAHDRSIFRR